MASYSIHGTSINLFDLLTGQPLSQILVSRRATEFTISNWDGSVTVFSGSGLAWDAAQGTFTAGTIKTVKHLSRGTVVDMVTDLALSASSVQAALESPNGAPASLRALMFAGDDVFDARFRHNDAALRSLLVTYAGDDLVLGGRGPDEVFGGSGRDTIEGNDGNDTMNGGLDDDVLDGNAGSDRLIGDGGADTLDGGAANDLLFGGAGDDIYLGGPEADIDTVVYTRSVGDLFTGMIGQSLRIIEPNGRDTLTGMERIATDEGIFVWNAPSATWIRIGAVPGAAMLVPGSTLRDTSGSDSIALDDPKFDIVIASNGNDTIRGAGSFDLLIGGNGTDTISGDKTQAETGGDRLYGDAGNDTLSGMGGGDLLYGGAGNDRMTGGNGNDTATGGAGADLFVFQLGVLEGVAQLWGNDVINDFQLNNDGLRFEFDTAAQTPSLTLAAAGWMVALPGAGWVLLKGLFTPGLTLDDLLA